MTFQEQVKRDSFVSATAYEFKSLAQALEVTDGIIFIYAQWSGTAIQSWRALTATIANLEFRPLILVVDADDLEPALAIKLLGELPQGNGETFWIKNGTTVARLAGYREADTEALLEHTKRLLAND